MKIKNLIQIIVSTPVVAALVVVQFSTPIISEVKAEVQCPAPATSSHVIIRSGSETGPIIGQWHAHATEDVLDPENVSTVHEDIFVEPGTRLYVTSYTEGVQAVNRTPGSTQSTTLASTLIVPNDRNPLYRPNGFQFIKQRRAVYLTDPVTQHGYIMASGVNSCWPIEPFSSPENDTTGSSAVFIDVSPNTVPLSCYVSTTTQSVDRGASGAYTVVVTGSPSVSGSVVVSLSNAPADVTAPNSTVVLDGTGGNQVTTSMQVFVGPNAPVSPPPHTLTISATKDGRTVECGRPELVVTDPLVPAINLVLSPPALVSDVPGSLEYLLEARCINGFNRTLTELTVTHGFSRGVTAQILNPTSPYSENTSIACGQTRKVKLTATDSSTPLDSEVDVYVSGTDLNTP